MTNHLVEKGWKGKNDPEPAMMYSSGSNNNYSRDKQNYRPTTCHQQNGPGENQNRPPTNYYNNSTNKYQGYNSSAIHRNTPQQGYKQKQAPPQRQIRHEANTPVNAQQNNQGNTQTQRCDRCTGNHEKSACKWNKETLCHACNKRGHIAPACRAGTARSNNQQKRPFQGR